MQKRLLSGIGISALVHAGALQGWNTAASHQRNDVVSVEIELSDVASTPGTAHGTQYVDDNTRAAFQSGGEQSVDNLHSAVHGGGGGHAGTTEVTFLVARIDNVVMSNATRANATVSQSAHANVADEIASRENRRATPHPAQAATLSTEQHGSAHTERDPRRGQVARRAQTEVPRTNTDEIAVRQPRTASTQTPEVAPVAPIRTQATRPDVAQGGLAVLAPERGAPRDSLDAPLRAAAPTPALAETSPRTGHENESAHGLGAPGQNGDRGHATQGGRGRAWSDVVGEGTQSPQFQLWHRDVRRRVENAVRFPQVHRINLDQGTTIVSVHIDRQGHMRDAPRIVRSSGFPAMDDAALHAVLDALPFPRPPPFVGTEDAVEVRIPVHFSNPLFQ